MSAKPIKSEKRTFELAKWGGGNINEIGLAKSDKKLTLDGDIHFGLNGGSFTHAAEQVGIYHMVNNVLTPLSVDYGPRIIDAGNRGGRTAEFNWYRKIHRMNLLKKNRAKLEPVECVTKKMYKDFNSALPLRSVKDDHDLALYPAYANESGENLFDSTRCFRYEYSGTNKLHTGDVMQMGARWSKTALEYAYQSNAQIHFHLDGMGDLKEIIKKKKIERKGNDDVDVGYKFNFNVTSQEFRYIWRHWERFKDSVIFYNGYIGSGKGLNWGNYKLYEAMMVERPWPDAWAAPERPDSDRVAKASDKHLTWGLK